ncbi:LOW QUALITY PROTEIN: serine hydrolase-like protein [Aphomia sociella]
MMNKVSKEWYVEMPWGVAMISWGDSGNPPVLLVHGYLDTAATFIRLVDLLPDNYYYVSFDFPGHGKSDHIGMGPLVTSTFMTAVIKRIVDVMGWEKFIYIGHSMAFLTGLFYNYECPGKIKLMINLDPEQPAGNQFYVNYLFKYWYKINYQEYYNNLNKYKQDVKLYTYEQAVSALISARSLSRDQAELLMTRCSVPVENGLHK